MKPSESFSIQLSCVGSEIFCSAHGSDCTWWQQQIQINGCQTLRQDKKEIITSAIYLHTDINICSCDIFIDANTGMGQYINDKIAPNQEICHECKKVFLVGLK